MTHQVESEATKYSNRHRKYGPGLLLIFTPNATAPSAKRSRGLVNLRSGDLNGPKGVQIIRRGRSSSTPLTLTQFCRVLVELRLQQSFISPFSQDPHMTTWGSGQVRDWDFSEKVLLLLPPYKMGYKKSPKSPKKKVLFRKSTFTFTSV